MSIAERHIQSTGNSDLTFNEIHGFADNFYVPIYETSTGNYAFELIIFELIIDRVSGAVMPEPGPDMMWNTKYGTMDGGMMGHGGQQQGAQVTPTVETPVSQDQAVRLAQEFLTSYLPGTMTGDVHSFYGYRTIEVTRGGQMQRMISVNGYNGAVWYHTWHGDFLEGWTRQGWCSDHYPVMPRCILALHTTPSIGGSGSRK
ncbi:MAG: hypothetical protein M1358_07730 [Chloroflexi bacterium]|nr:hypothetical protein [Chloroflexota bacterium]